MHKLKISVEEKVRYHRIVEVDDETYNALLTQKKIYRYDFSDFLVSEHDVADSELTDVMISEFDQEEDDWTDIFWETY